MGKNKKQTAVATKKKFDPMILGTLIFAAVVLIALVSVCVYRNSDGYIASRPALKIGDSEVSAAEYSYYYNNTVNGFISSNYNYLSYMGLDLNKSLASQTCGLNSSMTWAQYFDDMVKETVTQAEVLYAEGHKAGFAPEELAANVDKAIEEIKHHAEEEGKSFEEDMQAHYGRKFSENEIRKIVERAEYSSLYQKKVQDETETTQEQRDTYFSENKANYYRVSYRIESFEYSSTEKEGVDTQDEARKKADDMLAAVTDEASFETLARANYTAEELAQKGEDFTLRSDVLCSSLTTNTSKWMMEDGRKAGDKTVIVGANSMDVVYMTELYLDDYKTADIRMVYLPVEAKADATDEENKAAQKEVEDKANSLFGDWNKGDKSEESFIAMAKENSKDANVETGSLYEDVNKSSFSSDITNWIFALDRKIGDCQVFNTSTASYLVYVAGEGDVYWEQSVQAAVKQNNYNTWYSQTKNNYTVTADEDIIGKVLR